MGLHHSTFLNDRRGDETFWTPRLRKKSAHSRQIDESSLEKQSRKGSTLSNIICSNENAETLDRGKELEILIEESDVFIHPKSKIKQHEKFLKDCLLARKSRSNQKSNIELTREEKDLSKSENEVCKDVYKISITTASIDQKKNQLILNSPQIILPTSERSNEIGNSESLDPNEINIEGSEKSPIKLKKLSKTVIKLNGLDERVSTAKLAANSSGVVNRAILVNYDPENSTTAPSDEREAKTMLEAKVTAISIGNRVKLDPIFDPIANLTATSESSQKISPSGSTGTNDVTEGETSIHIEDNETSKQLTCELSLGDSIEIASAPILLPSSATRDDPNSTVIIPITSLKATRTLSNKRRHFIMNTAAIGGGTDQSDSFSKPAQEADNEDDVLEYSPILNTVKSYIDTFQDDTFSSTAVGGRHDLILPLAINSELRESIGTPMVSPTAIVSKAETLVVGSSCIQDCESSVSSSSIAQVDSSSVKLNSGLECESPKRSIFDGASKDEILEYLEDARERVPEILMAADDVMVLSENELIVVNQLDPGAPATPISIVQASEVIETSSSVAQMDQTAEGSEEALASEIQASESHLLKRQTFYQKQQQKIHSGDLMTPATTMDDDTGISGISGNEESYEEPATLTSGRDSYSPNEMMNDDGITLTVASIEHPSEATEGVSLKFDETGRKDCSNGPSESLNEITHNVVGEAAKKQVGQNDTLVLPSILGQATDSCCLADAGLTACIRPPNRRMSASDADRSNPPSGQIRSGQREHTRRMLSLIRQQRYSANRDSLCSSSSTSPSSFSGSRSSN